MTLSQKQQARLSLLPLMLFVALFLGTGLYLQSQGVDYAFYQLPGPVAIIPALVLAIWLYKAPLAESIEVLVKGAGNNNIITMCIIYLLAGAFATVAHATGGVDAVVNAGLSLVPAQFLLPGLFVISALVATAMGTSMGTIGALAPIAVGLSTQAQLEPALVAGVLLSGAIFGDNLSIISDTTIASTRTQGAQMKDKFRENLKIALPAALVTLVLFAVLAQSQTEVTVKEFGWTGVLPYAAILILAVAGMNVFAVLLLGLLLAALQGAVFADYQLANLGKDIYKGFGSMQEIFLLSMLVGALGEFVKQQGGLQYLSSHVTALALKLKLAGNKAQQLAIAALAFVSNLCIANNTVAIVVTGDVSKDIAQHHQITPKRSASLLDVFACIAQGLVPYGAQALLLGASFGLSPWDVVTQSYYCFILAAFAVGRILLEKNAPKD
ncbi:Na+/H+ antiporter NhaC family protein [Rheinheimera mesophila]|uniref:Na+/H+ antiporter NhaC family protein n=1 Tax=Rheinheimera mesophila TaxID=1547515 RepID=A0A3P3QE16_9GAMM|nr:Na+/H+ antiporter NhaC family protein [Rheinheimera mesophila]KKL02066.1 sodium:proton antiporter [Rheinheimera mesophila]RRJ19384.1 Na+/H+ antiporter NhaC family protein [Rheinheimera mesophila]